MKKLKRGKLSKHLVMKQSAVVARHLPHTLRYNRANFKKMLTEHRHAIVKPSGGWGGKGVIFASIKDNRYFVQLGARKQTFTTMELAAGYIAKHAKGPHVVQRKISLSRIKGRPYDLRVMVQRKRGPASNWKVTGVLAKVAGQGYQITNVARSGGRVISFEEAIRRSELPSTVSVQRMRDSIGGIAIATATQLARHYKGLRKVGLDMAVDTSGKLWIIEANFTPNIYLFKKLRDRSMYRKIVAYQA